MCANDLYTKEYSLTIRMLAAHINMFIKKIIEEKEHLKKINEEWAKMDEKWKHSCFAQKRPSSNNTLEPPPKKPKKDQPFEEAKAEKGKKSVSWSLC